LLNNLIRCVGLDQVSQKLPTALDIIAKYSALESLHLDELPADTDLILLENAISSHKSLIEIQTSINPSLPIESFRNIARKVRLVINQPDASNALDMPTFNFNTSTIFRQKDDVTFPTSNKIVKGISIFGKLIVGASDGTIYVYELNGDQYHIRQTLHEHQAEITCICHQPHYREDLVISSVVRTNQVLIKNFNRNFATGWQSDSLACAETE
jgi:WD40 repeat protein